MFDFLKKNKTNVSEIKDMSKSDIKKQVEDFIGDKQPGTKARKEIFDTLFSFTLDGKQWTAQEKEDLIADGFAPLVLNFSSDYVDRYIARLFPRNQRTGILEVGVRTFEDDDGENVKKIMGAYRRNYLPAILIEQGLDFLVGGAGCIYYPQNEVTKKADIISLDPRNVSLAWQGDKLMRFAHHEKFVDGSEETIYWDLGHFVHIIDNKVKIEKNKYDFIPVSWIPCGPRPHQHEGRSKILSLKDLDVESNENFCNFSKRIKDNTIPHVNIFSEKNKEDGYDRGRKKISFFGPNDDVRAEEYKESPEVLDFMKMLDDRMRRKTGIVDVGAAIKSVVSGISLSFQFSEMMDLIGFMRVYWDRGFRELNNAILNYEIKPGYYDTDPVYNPVLAYDSRQKVDEYDVLLRNKLITRKDAIAELRAVEDPDKVITDVIEEDKLFEYLLIKDTLERKKNEMIDKKSNLSGAIVKE